MMPPRSILAAVDFSESSRVSLDFAARLAAHCGVPLHVLHAQDLLLASAASSRSIDLRRETRQELVRFTAHLSQVAKGTPIHHHVVTGHATAVICDIAAREQVDLIVVGAHGISKVERAMFGSTTEGVLRRADVSVFVVPDSWTPPRPETADLSGMGPVVAAIESSCAALAGTAAACRLADALGTSVSAIHVVPDLPVLERWREHAHAAVLAQATRARQDISAALVGLQTSSPVPLDVEIGSVPDRLAHAATASGPHSILVLGRRPRTSQLGAPGATAYRVLALAQVPVLMHVTQESQD